MLIILSRFKYNLNKGYDRKDLSCCKSNIIKDKKINPKKIKSDNMQKVKIDLKEIAEECFVNKSLIEKVEENNLIKIYYHGKSPRNTPKPMILPKQINIDEEFVENIGMYIGDGTLSPKRKQTEFTTIDIDMAKKYLRFLRKTFNLAIDDMTFIVKYRRGRKREVKKKWANILEIPEKKIIAKKENKYKIQENMAIIVNSIIFTFLFKKIIEKLLPIIKENPNLFRVLKGKQLLTIEQFNNLTQLINKSPKNFYNQMNGIRIGKITYLPFSKKFIDFIIKEKFNGGDKIANCENKASGERSEEVR
jgi:hypothetical protein